MSTVLVLLIAANSTTILTSNLALADWKTSFQQKPQIATESAFPGGSAAIMPYVNKIGSGSSSSSSFLASSSTAKDPYEHMSSNNINPLQPRDGSPLASRTNNNNVDASAYSITTTGNTGFTPTTRTIQPMTITSEPSHAQRQAAKSNITRGSDATKSIPSNTSNNDTIVRRSDNMQTYGTVTQW